VFGANYCGEAYLAQGSVATGVAARTIGTITQPSLLGWTMQRYGSLNRSAGSDTNISATRESLTLTEYAASVAWNKSISATTDALTFTEYAANVALNKNISATRDALTITEFAASVAWNKGISATRESLTFTEYAASLAFGINVSATSESLTFTEYAASVSLNRNIAATVEALTFTEYAASVSTSGNYNISATSESLTLTEYPSVLSFVSTTGNSGEHRLANARSAERKRVTKDTYQSIDWNAPIFGETPKPEIPITVKIPEPKKNLDFSKEQNELSDIDREIQLLLKTVIAQEGAVAELAAIEQSIRESEAIAAVLEAERLEKKRRLALLLLFMAA